MLRIVQNLIEELDKYNICYVHFKSNEHLDESVEGYTDFDILIDRKSSQRYEECLLKLNFKRFVSPQRGSYTGVDDWIGFDDETGRLVHLHTHYQLVTGKAGYKNIVLPWSDIALQSRIRDKNTNMYIAKKMADMYKMAEEDIMKEIGSLEVVKYDLAMQKAIELLKENN